ncbi:preprotein translocase subunit SecY [Vagococcus lutrae]|uniref:Protein translocase subunit SecY n=2 Tax=Vagococcus lutrae TaxID=81947 RepID=V6Q384_9ENTE|nr:MULTISPECIES: preprotein translocase subunit SecY [Vagococcus]EST89227.1 preprotein translocase, SecY subunit [Vagococcus lutrae LBD1]MCO7150406.1 preprotein translocase subunit SecY [Vagococcus lutrae]MDT2802305.1 preprotein translocase subunit SecY [Vagococcus lutrae]MDT2806119.1 preprotein translocase subunit SecY [Vagococcus lutrae]MDT2807712.1 preprotein translocase subunit SecY [Vagococcus lutrae]
MFKLLKDGMKVKDIRHRIFFTLFILFAFRFGAHITVPGVDIKALANLSDNPLFNMINTVSGSAMENFSLFALGVSPYITSSIIIQLLQMDIVPKFVEWSKQGEVGRRKLNQATRYLTLVMAFLQSIMITAGFNQFAGVGFVKTPDAKTYMMVGIILTAGTMLVTWMGEQITDKGIGNGVSMIIFAGIISRIPKGIVSLIEDRLINIKPEDRMMNILFLVLLVVAILAIVTFVTYFNQAERKIPIQYTKRVAGAPQSSYLPLKVNAAGVIPVIFASSLLATPNAIMQLFSATKGSATWFKVVQHMFDYSTLGGGIFYTLLIVGFTFFYAFVQVNPEKVAENLQKQGSYIPSVRPGASTENYISSLLMRLSAVGSLFLAAVAILPVIAQKLWDLPTAIGLGGTSLLIAVGVALETAKQLEGLMMKRQYTGFIVE